MMGYAETKEKVEYERLIPWASATSYKIAGYEVSQPTLLSVVDLQLSRNFIVGGKSDGKNLIGDVITYLWRHTKHYKAKPTLLTKIHKHFFLRKISKLKLDEIGAKCIKHFSDATKESPAGIVNLDRTVRNLKMSACPTIAYLVDEVCGEYTITIDECINMPIPKLFQLIRCIRLRKKGEGRGVDISYSEPEEVKDAIKWELAKIKEATENG